ncbi:cytochrome ubiquinol oxidase subunit I [Nocardiopsis aegyptia]|uniref:cytochrome ubiquinol oxidase subunit I n=1 Tax=Nocardiopsis aegyptia TaxID=220378 RepID=UPI00366EA4A8
MFEDPLLLARLQFALTAATHFTFVALTLGLAPYILVNQLVATLRGDRRRMTSVRFWGGLYLVNYGMGVLSGLVMELQLAVNWNGLHEMFGYSFAAPLALETMTAFFVESTFLGLWIFGWDRMGRWAHFGCFVVVTGTAYLSAWWVLVANGFLRNPVGFEIVDGVAHLSDPVALMTNPAALLALGHIVSASLVLGALVVGAVSAYHLMRGNDPDGVFGRGIRYTAVTMVLTNELIVVFGGLQFGLFGEDPPTSGLTYTAEEIEAIEAASGGPLLTAANTAGEITMFTVYAFMFLIGPTMLVGWLLSRLVKPLRRWTWALAPLLVAPFLPYAGVVAGWVFRETNRQPWAVVHHLTTADAVTPMTPGMAVASFSFFTGAFAVLAVTTYWLLVRFARRGPQGGPLAERSADEPEQPAAPVHSF